MLRAAPVSLVGDGPHGVIALYAAALDARVRGVALRQTVTDYRSLAVAERYTQPFGIYAYGVLREFDLPDVARALGSRPVLLVNPVTARGESAGTGGARSVQECAQRHRSDLGCCGGPATGRDFVDFRALIPGSTAQLGAEPYRQA